MSAKKSLMYAKILCQFLSTFSLLTKASRELVERYAEGHKAYQAKTKVEL